MENPAFRWLGGLALLANNVCADGMCLYLPQGYMILKSELLVEMLNIVGERGPPNLEFACDVRAA